ncbi:MAG: MFS transporter [Bacteroidia bacterium]|nr:MFS transporter [Bacteroidia bacterium]
MHRKKVVFWSSCLGMLLFGIALITLGSVVPDLKVKLQLDEISSGTLFSILPFGVLAGSMIFGPVVDKYSYRILLSVSCVFMFAGFLGIAVTQSQGLLRFCAFLIGFGGGAVNGATNALVADISDKDKGANLSLLGVFFGIGALGMPLILGILKDHVSFEIILTAVAVVTIITGMIFMLVKFPPPKQPHGFPVTRSFRMLKDNVLILIAFFLFFQSSFEGILNNWTTTYFIDHLSVPQNSALYALSSFVAGMVVMRLLIGSVLRSLSVKNLLSVSFILILAGLIFLRSATSLTFAVAGLVLLGAGLAAGFPVMLGLVGERYAELSGTAFSLVLFIALTGNMIINYMMGIIARNSGIHHLTTVAFAEFFLMILLSIFIFSKTKRTNK